MKKVVLIAPPYDFADNANVARFTTLLAPPLGILTLGSYLAANGVPIEIIDMQMDFGFGLTRETEAVACSRLARYLGEQGQTIGWVGISQISNSRSGIALANKIRAALPATPIVFGGYFPTNNYQLLLSEYPFIDAVVRGDGETAALQISQQLEAGQPFPNDQISNLAWQEGGEIHTTPMRVTNLDQLPTLDFRLLRNPDSYPIIELVTSRGCPFDCNYCLESSMRPYAVHSPEWVARQLDHLEATVSNERLFFFDPLFGLGRERTIELCRIMRGRQFTYGVESRVDVLPPDLIPVLRQAGVEVIYLGIESASPATLQRMNKVHSPSQARRYLDSARAVLQACFENGITPFMGFMLGFPGDVEADYQATAGFVQDVGRLHGQSAAQTGAHSGFVPLAFYTKVYAGSPLVEMVEQNGSQVVLRPEPFIGERTVVSPSPGLDLNTARRYQDAIVHQGAYTPLAMERWRCYSSFSMEALLQEHPELTDSDGVICLGDSLRRFPPPFDLDAMLMHHDKSKNPH